MAARNSPDDVPEIAVRIPGTWSSARSLGKSLPRGYQLGEGRLVMPDGELIEVHAMPPDGQFPGIFIQGCRRVLTPRQRDRVRGYRVNVCLMRKGGSVPAARRMLQAAAAIVAAGGMGVFVDNSGNTHYGSDWVALAAEPDDGAVILAFVGIYGNQREVWSVGMHVMGMRDAVIPRTGDEQGDIALLSSLLGYTVANESAIVAGDFVGDGGEASYRVHSTQPARIPRGSVMYNPYGCWRLEPVEAQG